MEYPVELYNSYLEVDLNIICENYRRAYEEMGGKTEIIPVLKSNAYNLGAYQVAKALTERMGARIIAVAHILEAVSLRDQGLTREKADILLTSAVSYEVVDAAVAKDIQLPVFSRDIIYRLKEAAERQGKKAEVQIAVNTGLNRIGTRPGAELEKVLDALEECREWVEAVGIYTHFATGQDYQSPFAAEQYARFQKAKEQAGKRSFTFKYIHVCDSAASDWYKEARETHVRLARRLYMRHYETEVNMKPEFYPVEAATWNTRVTSIISVKAGESLGYNRKIIADRPMRAALIGIGYGDGICHEVIGKKETVLVNEQLTGFLAMCMDQSMIDVTGLDCQIGDEVILFGYSQKGTFLSAEDVGRRAGLDGCYIYSYLTERVKRVYKGE